MLAFNKFNLAELPELSAAQYGSRPALSMVVGSVYTYRDFERLSRGIAQALSAYGVKKGDRVALLAENSPHWVIAWFGIVRAGAIIVPILNDFMPKQIANIIQHSGAKIVFASNKLQAKLAEMSPKPEIWDISKDFEPSADFVELPAVEADDLAMIVYTSGTTGISKGVMLSHRNILSNAVACKSIITLRRTDRLLSILPLAHTYEFTIGMVIPLLYGAHIFYLDRPPSASALLPALKAVRPTIMLSVPLVIEKVYQSGIAPELNRMKLYKNKLMRPLILRIAGMKLKKTFGGHLRFFGIGGAPLAADVEEFLNKAHFPYAIGYGLTETAPLIAGCAPKATFLRSTGPVLKGVELRIADPKTSTGEGEIQARGPNIFKGYWKDEARTKEAFTEDGWFRTGDLGSIDNKGRLFVRGRLKTLILGASGEISIPKRSNRYSIKCLR